MSEVHRTRDQIAEIVVAALPSASEYPFCERIEIGWAVADALAAGFVFLPPGMTAEKLRAIARRHVAANSGRDAGLEADADRADLRSWADSLDAVSSRLPEPETL
jgi:hypothetical protein